MKSVLEEFACGNITQDVVYYRKNSPDLDRIMGTLCDSEDKLMSVLDGELKQTFKHLIEAQMESSYVEGTNRFICGYRLGVLMTMEVFYGKDEFMFGNSNQLDNKS